VYRHDYHRYISSFWRFRRDPTNEVGFDATPRKHCIIQVYVGVRLIHAIFNFQAADLLERIVEQSQHVTLAVANLLKPKKVDANPEGLRVSSDEIRVRDKILDEAFDRLSGGVSFAQDMGRL
jgi:hypothetical protein